MISEIGKVVNIPICMHCHDDLGMALANTLAAAKAGAKQLHTTVNGIGKRSGNTPLEELLMALRLHYGIDRYDFTELTSISKNASVIAHFLNCHRVERENKATFPAKAI